MTVKQEKILFSALELFAGEGFDATSTKKIAKHAGVSEGLIFRHFENKKGLLQAILANAYERIQEMTQAILAEEDPKEVLRKAIEMPFSIDPKEYDFWRLVMQLKWEKEHYDPKMSYPMLGKLTEAFQKLGKEEPDMEALKLNYILDALAIHMLKGDAGDAEGFKNFLLKDHNL